MRYRSLFYPLSIIKQVLYLPKSAYQNMLERNALRSEITSLKHELATIASHQKEHAVKLDEIAQTLKLLENKIPSPESRPSDKAARRHLDNFYKLFEDRFRGTEENIKKRVSEYKPYFDALPEKLKKRKVIDLGSGRGEFLSFAKDAKLKALGIDTNYDMVERAKSHGYVAIQTDALDYIMRQKNDSLAAVTGFHIVEHLPFDTLLRLFEECYRAIAPGGFVLFETPNPQNLITATSNFYIDPSHIKPVPSELLAYTLESMGFAVKIIPAHPRRASIKHQDKEVAALMQLVYGPQDYAVIAQKP